MADYCIVAVTFNRPASFLRLFSSLLAADYGCNEVDLLVSIDGGPGSAGTEDALGVLEWPFGTLRVRRLPENLGLRCHILSCGDEALNYKAIILLEDDIVVGPGFFRYSNWACHHYGDHDQIAGISLYAPAFNEMANLPFIPAPSQQPVYTLQSAQSWGQCWTREMWSAFRAWYSSQAQTLSYAPDMPDRIYSWPDSSWKKFAMKYLVETGLTWIYPYVSHSTNCSEIGTHNRQLSSLFQVPLAPGFDADESLPINDLIRYDSYFERVNLDSDQSDLSGQLILDLYGTRQRVTGPTRLLTVRRLQQEPIAQFGLQFKPHEANFNMGSQGKDVSLYEIGSGETINLLACERLRPGGFHGTLEWRDSLKVGLDGLSAAIVRRLKRSLS